MSLTLLDWRRRIDALYAEIRATSDVRAAHRLWQQGRDDLFAHHPESPLLPEDRARFTGLAIAAYDPTLRFEAEVDPDVAPLRLEVPTGTDGVVAFERIGRVHLGRRGNGHRERGNPDGSDPGSDPDGKDPGSDPDGRDPDASDGGDLGDLDVWWLASYGGGLFVPVKDTLAGRSTYGGGRYLIDTVKGADLGSDGPTGALVIDLNFAYNPSCAYDPAWACPLAPAGNVLTKPVMAGELAGHHL